MSAYLDLADFLLIAEAVLGVPAEGIASWPGIGVADSALHAPAASFGGVQLYPDVIDKAVRVAYLALLPFLARNGVEWSPPSLEETAATIEGVAAGTISEPELADWLRATSRAPQEG